MINRRPLVRASLQLLLALFGLLSCVPVIKAQSELDASYTPSLLWRHSAIGIQPDGKVVTGEGYRTFSTGTRISRINTNGTLDGTFNHIGDTLTTSNNGEISAVKSVSAFMDGTMALTGYFSKVSGKIARKVVRINEAGQIVPYPVKEAKNNGEVSLLGWVVAPRLVSLPDNRAYLFGDFTSISYSGTRKGIARLDALGAVETTLVASAETSATGQAQDYSHQVNCVVQQPDGKILVSGEFDRFNGQNTGHLVRLSSTGTLDSTFLANANGVCYSVLLLPDGKILVAGSFTSIGGGTASRLARLNANGTLDSTFSCNVDGDIWSMASRVDGRVVICGNFLSVNGVLRSRIALIEANGSLNGAYASGPDNYIDG